MESDGVLYSRPTKLKNSSSISCHLAKELYIDITFGLIFGSQILFFNHTLSCSSTLKIYSKHTFLTCFTR